NGDPKNHPRRISAANMTAIDTKPPSWARILRTFMALASTGGVKMPATAATGHVREEPCRRVGVLKLRSPRFAAIPQWYYLSDSLLPQVCLLDLRVRGDFFGRAFERDAAGL